TNPLGVICAPGHPLSRRRNAPLSILNDQVFVVRENGSGTRHAMERLFGEYDIHPQVAMEMPSNETIKQAVMAGMGMSFLSLRTAPGDRRRPAGTTGYQRAAFDTSLVRYAAEDEAAATRRGGGRGLPAGGGRCACR